MTPAVTVDCGAVLFDMDGVLVDSSGVVERSWRSWARRHGIAESVVMPLIHGRRALETIALVAPHLDAQAEWQVLIRQELEDTEGFRAFPGAAALAGSLPLDRYAIVTSAPRSIAVDRLRRGAIRVPAVMVCAEDVSRGKPAPDGYLLAAERLGVPAGDCVVVEDAAPGVQAGLAAGMRVLGFTTTQPAEAMGAATWLVPDISCVRAGEPVADGVRLTLTTPRR
ncbi:glycerol-3-phosphatase [Thalassobaculum fulvum]|uniref:Glycerol-3-phosphatase n=1 Tax=Thalassobaculum fulvum TaxID=1633335 RepID=A0A918XSR6_9PROT|nr:HAD-IA family hydrolase [Thalassobaculum fulvum]GHD53133.1 glycerol-3-phosphatase [Thalassobaculum fulvum]